MSGHEIDNPGAVAARRTEDRGVGARAFEVEVVLHLPTEAQRAEDLHASLGCGHVSLRLASYKVPKSVDFIETMPVISSGKVSKRELRERYWKDHARGVA